MALDYVDINRTEAQLTHAIDSAEHLEISSSGTASMIKLKQDNITTLGGGTGNNAVDVVALGQRAVTQKSKSVAIGEATTFGENSIAIGGKGAYTTNDNSIQLGKGTNRNANTVQIFDTTVLNEDGNIPFSALEKVQKLLVAGNNVTITDNGDGTATISATGGGGTSFTVDTTMSFVNNVLGIDFAEDTGSGLETGKAVRSNEFNTAMETISTTFGNFVTQLQGKQDVLTAGQNVSISNNVISSGIEVIKI